MNTTQTALARVIFSCIIGLTILGVMSFYRTPYSPETVIKIIDSLGGIVLATIGAKAGLSIPASEKESTPNNPDATPEKK